MYEVGFDLAYSLNQINIKVCKSKQTCQVFTTVLNNGSCQNRKKLKTNIVKCVKRYIRYKRNNKLVLFHENNIFKSPLSLAKLELKQHC